MEFIFEKFQALLTDAAILEDERFIMDTAAKAAPAVRMVIFLHVDQLLSMSSPFVIGCTGNI